MFKMRHNTNVQRTIENLFGTVFNPCWTLDEKKHSPGRTRPTSKLPMKGIETWRPVIFTCPNCIRLSKLTNLTAMSTVCENVEFNRKICNTYLRISFS